MNFNVNTVRKRFFGPGAQGKLNVGYKLLDILRQNMTFNNLDQLVMRKWVDGTYFEVSSVFGQNEIRIYQTAGDEQKKIKIDQTVAQVSSNHIVWGNAFPASIRGYFGLPGPPVEFFQDQKNGLIGGLGNSSRSLVLDDQLSLTRISVASPATHILGSFDRDVYGYLLTLEELRNDYNFFGQGPFENVDISRWHIDGFIDFAEINPDSDNIIPFGFNSGSGFFRTFFNSVRTPQFAADMLTHYFRENGNVPNANFDNDTTLPVQRKYSIIDTFAGVFTDYGAEKINFDADVVEPGFVGTYGEDFVSFYRGLEESEPELKSYWYVSFVIFDPGQRITRAPTEIELLFDRATVYEQNAFSQVDEDGFQTVTNASQANLLGDIGRDIARDIEEDQIAALASRLGADYTHQQIIDLSPDGL